MHNLYRPPAGITSEKKNPEVSGATKDLIIMKQQAVLTLYIKLVENLASIKASVVLSARHYLSAY